MTKYEYRRGDAKFRFPALLIALRSSVALFLAAALLSLFVPGNSYGAWPFSAVEKEPAEPYVAEVGDKLITRVEFFESVDRLHKSDRAGKALEGTRSFVKLDYRKFLDEIIVDKLMVIEAENLGLDKERYYIRRMGNLKLNMFLSKLQREEIYDHIKVEEWEVEDYFIEQYMKKEREQREALEEAQRIGHAQNEAEPVAEAEVAEAEGAEAEGEMEAAPPVEADIAGLEEAERLDYLKKMTFADRKSIKQGFINERAKQREKVYFEELVSGARVVIDEEVLKDVSSETPELLDKVVASFDQETITAREFLGQLRGRVVDPDRKRIVLDSMIRNKLLDNEAMGKGYEKLPEMKKLIRRQSDRLLIELFKSKVLSPFVKVEEEDIAEYYEKNKDDYKYPDMVEYKMITVKDEQEAMAIIEELESGADFSYIARDSSIDTAAKDGGVRRPTPIDRVSADVSKAFTGAKAGDVVGPFVSGKPEGFSIFKLIALKMGGYKPLDKVTKSIRKSLAKQRYNAVYNKYIKRLRQAVPIKVNEEEMARIEGE